MTKNPTASVPAHFLASNKNTMPAHAASPGAPCAVLCYVITAHFVHDIVPESQTKTVADCFVLPM